MGPGGGQTDRARKSSATESRTSPMPGVNQLTKSDASNWAVLNDIPDNSSLARSGVAGEMWIGEGRPPAWWHRTSSTIGSAVQR